MPSDPYEIVTTGAKMECTFGFLPGVFQSTHDAVFTTGGFSNAATADMEAYKNIPSFLICTHPQNSFNKCVPTPPPGPVSAWQNTHPAEDSGEEILLVRSCTTCMNGPGSKINFLDSGQVGPAVFKVINPLEEEIAEIEAVLEELEPGTPEYDELLRELADLKNRNTDFNNLPLGSEMGEYFNDNISKVRQAQLSELHRELVDQYLENGELSHSDIGEILDDLRDMDTLSDVEKAYVWTELADNKEEGAWIIIGGSEGDYVINNGGVNPDVIDSAFFNGDATQVHTVVGFTDGYHGRMGGITGDNGAAEIEIEEHEAGRGLPRWMGIPRYSPNEGDANASNATVDAFRGFREDGFDKFADRWQDNMLAPPQEVVDVPTGTTTTVPVPVPVPVPTPPTTTTIPNTPTGTTTPTTTTPTKTPTPP